MVIEFEWSTKRITIIKTWTLVFPSEENYNEFLGESVRLTYYNDMQLYNEQNGISDSIDIQDV